MIKTAAASALWFPGTTKLEGLAAAPMSARAKEIAKSREELLGLLRDLPESDYELSFTDLVEKSVSTDSVGAISGCDKKVDSVVIGEADRAPKLLAKDRKKTRSGNRSSFGGGGGGDGVLLNFYVPTVLQRSLTAPRSGRRTDRRVAVDYNKRDRQPMVFGCWSGLWERRREKSRRSSGCGKKEMRKSDHHGFPQAS